MKRARLRQETAHTGPHIFFFYPLELVFLTCPLCHKHRRLPGQSQKCAVCGENTQYHLCLRAK